MIESLGDYYAGIFPDASTLASRLCSTLAAWIGALLFWFLEQLPSSKHLPGSVARKASTDVSALDVRCCCEVTRLI